VAQKQMDEEARHRTSEEFLPLYPVALYTSIDRTAVSMHFTLIALHDAWRLRILAFFNLSLSPCVTKHVPIPQTSYVHKHENTYTYLFFAITLCSLDIHNTHSPLWTPARKPYPYHLRRLDRQILEIDEVTTGASLWIGTSLLTTKHKTPLNPKNSLPRRVKT